MKKFCRPKQGVSLKTFTDLIPVDNPILFWDSCSLLYILSVPTRNAYDSIQWYEDILNWIESGDIISVTSDIVRKEFSDHYEKVLSDARANESRYKQYLNSYTSNLKEPDRINLINKISDIELVSHLDDIQKRIWKNTYVFKGEASFNKKAHYRVLNKISPSMKKDQYKDSYIWITFAEMSKRLPPARYKCFMTENKEDFCINRGTIPQERIENDAKSVNGEFFCSLETLRNTLITKIRQ